MKHSGKPTETEHFITRVATNLTLDKELKEWAIEHTKEYRELYNGSLSEFVYVLMRDAKKSEDDAMRRGRK